ncbi:MAG: hypothetical protein KIT56_00665 [Gammaproteobacteria bacterium]|nr:hypothetical protein [Gammaproteobacteria bacterium]MCW5582398.1 hypothetical protein [Gammaproteobacteria bacterium]
MKIKLWIICLLLTSSTPSIMAMTNQEIVNFLNQPIKHYPIHTLTFKNKQHATIHWEALHGPQQMGWKIKTVQMKNQPSILFAFRPGTNEQLLRSNDAGNTWIALSLPSNIVLNSLLSIDENRLLLGTESGVYLSNDKGNHWEFAWGRDKNCYNMVAANPNLILMLTDKNTSSENLYRSIDGGKSWTPAHLGLNRDLFIWGIGGRDDLLLAGTDGLNISTNGGLFWTQAEKWKNFHIIYDIVINSKKDIYLTDYYRLYKTDPMGKTWEKINTGIAGNTRDVKIDTKDHIYIVSHKDKSADKEGLYKSTDNGQTWQLLHSFSNIGNFTILDNGKLLVSTEQGLMLSDESQLNYSAIPTPFSISETADVLAIDDNHLFMIDGLYNNSDIKKTLYRSSDAGKTWEISYYGKAQNIVQFNHQLVLAADGNLILTSNDLGKTWQEAYQFTDKRSHDGLSVQHNALVVMRTDGQYVSSDLLHWQKFYDCDFDASQNMAYIDDANLIYLNTGNTIQYSSDLGKTWAVLLDNIHERVAGLMSGYQSKVLLAAFSNAGVIKSMDGGKSWDLINNGLYDFNFKMLKVLDENNYYLATGHGVFHTQDGGLHWVAENNGLGDEEVLSLYADHHLLLAGTNSGVYRAYTKATSLHAK